MTGGWNNVLTLHFRALSPITRLICGWVILHMIRDLCFSFIPKTSITKATDGFYGTGNFHPDPSLPSTAHTCPSNRAFLLVPKSRRESRSPSLTKKLAWKLPNRVPVFLLTLTLKYFCCHGREDAPGYRKCFKYSVRMNKALFVS